MVGSPLSANQTKQLSSSAPAWAIAHTLSSTQSQWAQSQCAGDTDP
ncbi:hypothetical protein [Coleofasciculus sp. FACHB-129]|nr:hypothetical protein [Coleofasciculus sp. FACHB-129]MBD1895914.1 hypothetical protein [Coleofasciculus sp. FACHB-129]